MATEMLIGVNVTDDEGYTAYRAAMTPILKTYGGGFSHDFRVSEVLQSQTEAPINRVFTIFFRNDEAKDAFFADEEYVKVKRCYFEPSVSDTTIIATYQK
jgi:uncharacterized protein (DUF1330 family)